MIKIDWKALRDDDPDWNYRGCLYAYLTTNSKEILYIGKAWGVTVRSRWSRSGKEKFWDDLETQRKIYKHIPIIGKLRLPSRQRLTAQLLADVESLLIGMEEPWGNIQSRDTRISRPGMTVECSGKWPGRKVYHDK